MMNIIDSIIELLHTNGFVIVPDWGAFFLTPVSAYWDHHKQCFIPPSYTISFNSRINYNDGLLFIHISNKFNIQYFEVIRLLKNQVNLWKEVIYTQKELYIENFGRFTLQSSNSINFEPVIIINNIPEYFGLEAIPIGNNAEQSIIFDFESINYTKLYRLAKVAVLIPFFIALSILPFKINNYNILQRQNAAMYSIEVNSSSKKTEKLLDCVDSLTEIKNALSPTIKKSRKEDKINVDTSNKDNNAELAKKETITVKQNRYYAIIGSFTNEKQTEMFLNDLKSINIEAKVLNCEGKFRVALDGYENYDDAKRALNKFTSNNPSYSGWILKW